jgi:hypothetical protein
MIGELDDGLFLDLRPRHDPVRDARILRQADEVRILFGITPIHSGP